MPSAEVESISGVSRGLSLRFHGVMIVFIFLQGAFGSFLGMKASHYMVWPFLTVIMAYSFLAITKHEKVIVSVPELKPVIIAVYLLCMWRTVVYFWGVLDDWTFRETLKTVYLLIFILTSTYVVTRSTREDLLRFIAYVVTISLLVAAIALVYNLMIAGGLDGYGKRTFKKDIIMFYRPNVAGAAVLLLALWNWLVVFAGGRYLKVGLFNVFLSLFLLIGIASLSALGGVCDINIRDVIVLPVYRSKKDVSFLLWQCLRSCSYGLICILCHSIYSNRGLFDPARPCWHMD
ncbi:hypothetical protein ACFL4R_00070 [Nitrospirota bacterium]